MNEFKVNTNENTLIGYSKLIIIDVLNLRTFKTKK